ncbi:beta-xylanase [Algimonas ampicilliniresistens]|uniref:Beta-xylanase n=1 Tax=Algimonas ampicilliniresistens TaxID=1298735 RepID=A0ABQ5VEV5_9PROT|nr:endo-1,4-beta-xylanase [Algimonas ampicilliniresistens]GLQ24967.1 beta-xylanase [Algimonas ampicilliniresistens]
MIGLTRRTMLAASAATTVLGGCGSIPSKHLDQRAIGLNAIAQSRGLRFGTAINSNALTDPAYLDIIKRDCGVLVAENEHKIYVVQGTEGPMQWDRPDAIVDFANQNNMAMRGHVLLWNRDDFLPGWMPDVGFDQASMAAYLDRYFTDMAMRYRGRIDSWDVVNETIDPGTGLPRDTLFTQTFGPDVIDWAFRKARSLMPDTQLVYNDYMIWEPWNEKHRMGILKLLEGFRARDVPIDAFGIQSHLGTGDGDVMEAYPDPQRREWRDFVDEIVGMDYELILSEFDVNDTRITADIAKRDAQVAAYGGAFLDMMLDYKEVGDVLAWGMADHYSWLQTWWPRKDGMRKRATLYDEDLNPKPLYDAVANSLRNAPVRPVRSPSAL